MLSEQTLKLMVVSLMGDLGAVVGSSTFFLT